jgi:hypothetical protein
VKAVSFALVIERLVPMSERTLTWILPRVGFSDGAAFLMLTGWPRDKLKVKLSPGFTVNPCAVAAAGAAIIARRARAASFVMSPGGRLAEPRAYFHSSLRIENKTVSRT